jgi:hypothetical protein
MATQQIEFEAPSGMTLTCTLHVEGSDSIAKTASAVVEQTNRKGVYRATFSTIAAAFYQLIARSGTTGVASWWGYAQDTAQTFVFGGNVRQMDGYVTSDISSRIAGDIDNDLNGWDTCVGKIASLSGERTWDTGLNPTRTITGGTISTVSDKTGYSLANSSITSSTFASGAITAAAIAADAIGSDELATSAITEIATAVHNYDYSGGAVDGSFQDIVSSMPTLVWLNGVRTLTAGAITSSTFSSGAITATVIAADAIGSSEFAASAVSAIADAVHAYDYTLTPLDSSFRAKITDIGDNLVDVKTKTDQMVFTVANKVDANATVSLGPGVANDIAEQIRAMGVAIRATQADDGTIALYDGRTYDGTAHDKLNFPVLKDYTAATSIGIKFYNNDAPNSIFATGTGTAATTTLVEITTFTATFTPTPTFEGTPAVFECRYAVVADWNGVKETIATGPAFLYSGPA